MDDDMSEGEYQYQLSLVESAEWDVKWAKLERGVWTTSGREEVHVSEMTDAHVRNTAAYLKRNMRGYWGQQLALAKAWVTALEREMARRKVVRDGCRD